MLGEQQEYSKLDINCPNCDELNTVKLSTEIKCKKCEKSLTQWKYNKLKKPVIGTLSALLIGGVAGHHIDDYFDKTRYPIKVEYTILENCISSDDKPLQRSYIRQKRDVCICALSETIKDVDYGEYKSSGYKFLSVFDNKAIQCQ